MVIKTSLRGYILGMLIVFAAGCSNPSVSHPTGIAIPSSTATSLLISTNNPTITSIPTTVVPTALPTIAFIPIFTPNAFQVENWRQYQLELAKGVIPYLDYLHPEFDYASVICEWDFLGASGKTLYVWAVCTTTNAGDSKPAALYLGDDGSIQKVDAPVHGATWDSDIQRLFPADIQEKIQAYFLPNSRYAGQAEELRSHLRYRITNPEVPPLIILSAVQSVIPSQ